MRNNYLEWISYYREKGDRIYYQDEIWVFKNMTCAKIWKDIAADAMESEYRVPAGKIDRSIVCHVRCAESGQLENCLILFRGSKSS